MRKQSVSSLPNKFQIMPAAKRVFKQLKRQRLTHDFFQSALCSGECGSHVTAVLVCGHHTHWEYRSTSRTDGRTDGRRMGDGAARCGDKPWSRRKASLSSRPLLHPRLSQSNDYPALSVCATDRARSACILERHKRRGELETDMESWTEKIVKFYDRDCRVSTLCYVSTFRDGKRPSGEGRGARARARSVARPASALWGGDCDVTVGCAPRRQLN